MITVTINNYNGKKITYTMPDDGTINTWTVNTFKNGNSMYLTNVTLELMHSNKIEVKEEQYEQTNKEKETKTKE